MNSFVKKDAPSVFLCYAHEDLLRVHALYSLLKGLGLRPWFDKYDLIGGERWENAIERAVKSVDFFIATFSRASVEKRSFVQREYRLAMDALEQRPYGEVFLIPVRLDDCELPDLRSLGNKLSDFQRVDLFQTGKLTVDDIAPILRTIESHSRWRVLQPHVVEIVNEYSEKLEAELMETMNVRELPLTDEIIDLKTSGDKTQLRRLEEEAFKRYLSVSLTEMHLLGMKNFYLVARYLYSAILDDDSAVCRHRPFIYPIHQYLSSMIRTAKQIERELLVATLIKWFTTKDIYQTSRDFAVFELGMSKTNAAEEALLKSLDDPFELPLVRYYAALAVGMVGNPDSLGALADIFRRERDEKIRKIIAHAIVHIRRQIAG